MTRTGGCLCGAVRYAFDAEPTWAGWCHCSMCRKTSGAVTQAWVTVPSAALRWSGKPPKVYVSSSFARRSFCPDCGSQLTFQFDRKPESIDLSVGTLDDASFVQMQEHVFWHDRLPQAHDDGLPKRESEPNP